MKTVESAPIYRVMIQACGEDGKEFDLLGVDIPNGADQSVIRQKMADLSWAAIERGYPSIVPSKVGAAKKAA